MPRTVIALLLLASLWLPEAMAADCNLAHIHHCSNTNQLVWAEDFEPAVEAFLGVQQAAFLYETAPLAAQMIDVLGGPPEDVTSLPDDDLLFAACRAHSCQEKGAVAISPHGRIRAMAILSYHIGTTDQVDQRFLDIYVCPDTKASTRAAMGSWGIRAVATEAAAHPKSVHDTDVGRRTAIHVLRTTGCETH